jgi:raffinose/stachyose/melibiose transport system substrate-binding protein
MTDRTRRSSRWFFVVLAALAVLAWAGLRRDATAAGSPETVLRVAHMNSYPAVMAAFDRVARDYERLHPGIRIEQILVPQRMYPAWLRTRLVGGVAPDLVEITGATTNEDVARYFRDLTQELRQPNPHNRDTALANIPWGATFVTGLQERPNYIEPLVAYYSVPLSLATHRLIYNRDLLEKTFGVTELPRTAAALAKLCAQIAERSRADNLGIIPFATEGDNGREFLKGIMRAATEETLLQLDPYGNYWNWDDEIAIAWLLKRWSLETPALRTALGAMGDMGRQLPPGFLQFGKGEGTFQFLQGKAVFLVAPSFEFTMFRESCAFPLGIMAAPVVGDRSRPSAEGNIVPVASLALPLQAPNAALALDFLRYLSSQPVNRVFTETSLWLPAVKGFAPVAELAAFAPESAGRPPGFSLWLFSRADYLTVERHLHELIGPGGSVERFTDALRSDFGPGVRTGLKRRGQLARQVTQRLDTVLGAADRLAANGADDSAAAERNPARILEVQVIFEARAAYYDLALKAADAEPGSYFAPLPDRPPPLPPVEESPRP